MRFCFPLMMVLAAVGLGGCASTHTHARQVREPGYLVPTAAIIQTEDSQSRGTADHVLPESDSYTYFVRGEKVAWGNMPVYEFSAYSIYTYDVQRLSSRGEGGGYRYRLGVQSEVSTGR